MEVSGGTAGVFIVQEVEGAGAGAGAPSVAQVCCCQSDSEVVPVSVPVSVSVAECGGESEGKKGKKKGKKSGDKLFLELEDIPLTPSPSYFSTSSSCGGLPCPSGSSSPTGGMVKVEAFRVYFAQFDRMVDVVLSSCTRNYYINVLLPTDAGITSPVSFNTRILCPLEHLEDPLQLKVVDGPFLLAEHPHELRLYPLGGPADSFISKPYSILCLPQLEWSQHTMSNSNTKSSISSSQTTAQKCQEDFKISLSSVHSCRLFGHIICLLRLKVCAMQSPSVGCGWYWMAVDLSAALTKYEMAPYVSDKLSKKCKHVERLPRFGVSATSETETLLIDVPLLRETMAQNETPAIKILELRVSVTPGVGSENCGISDSTSSEDWCLSVSCIQYCEDINNHSTGRDVDDSRCAVLLADMRTGNLTRSHYVWDSGKARWRFRGMSSVVLFSPQQSHIPLAVFQTTSRTVDDTKNGSKAWSAWVNSIDSALLSTNISNFRHTDAETFSCNEILVIGIMGTPSLEEGGEGESVFSLNQEVDRTKNKKSGAGTVQLLRASTLKILQVFEDVGGFALTSHWSGGGYQMVMLAPEIILKHRIFQIFTGGHVFTSLCPANVDKQTIPTDSDSSSGSSLWCIIELSGESGRGVSGIYSSVGECGSIGAWLDEDPHVLSNFTTLSTLLEVAKKYHTRQRKFTKKEKKRKKKEIKIGIASSSASDLKKKRKAPADLNYQVGKTQKVNEIECDSTTGIISKEVENRKPPTEISNKVSQSPQLEMQKTLQARLLLAHIEIDGLLEHLNTKSETLFRLRTLLRQWSTSFILHRNRSLTSWQRQIKITLGVQSSSEIPVASHLSHGLVSIFPPPMPPAAPHFVPSTRPVSSMRFVSDDTYNPYADLNKLDNDVAVNSGLSQSGPVTSVNISQQRLMGQHMPWFRSPQTGDANVTIVGSVAKIVSSTQGNELIVLLAVKNIRRTGSIHRAKISASLVPSSHITCHNKTPSLKPDLSVLVTSGVVQSLSVGEVSILSAHLELRCLTSPHAANDWGWREWNQDVLNILHISGQRGHLDSTALAISLSTLLNISVRYELSNPLDSYEVTDVTDRHVSLSEMLSSRASIDGDGGDDPHVRFAENFDNFHPIGFGEKKTVKPFLSYGATVGLIVVPPLGIVPICDDTIGQEHGDERKGADEGGGYKLEKQWHDDVSIAFQPLPVVRCFAECNSSQDFCSDQNSRDVAFWEIVRVMVEGSIAQSPGNANIPFFSFLNERSFMLSNGGSTQPTTILRDIGISVVQTATSRQNGEIFSLESLRSKIIEFSLHNNDWIECTSRNRNHPTCLAQVSLATKHLESVDCKSSEVGSDCSSDIDYDSDMNTTDRIESGGRRLLPEKILMGTIYSKHIEDVLAAVQGLQYRVALESHLKFQPHTVKMQVRHSKHYQHSIQKCAILGRFVAACILDELRSIARAWRTMNEEDSSPNSATEITGREKKSRIQLGPFVHMLMGSLSVDGCQNGSGRKESVSIDSVIRRIQFSRRTDLAVSMLLVLTQATL